MAVRGWVQGCTLQPRGSELTADVLAGGTVLPVEDLTDFDDDPGLIQINDQLYTYSAGAIDEDASTITLDVGLAVDALEGDWVFTVAGGLPLWDCVLTVSCGDGDDIEVYAPFTQRDLWPEGDYDDPVQILLSDDLERIKDVPGRIPVSTSLTETRTDLQANLDQVNADLAELNDVTLPQVQSDLANNEAAIATLDGKFPIGSTDISDGAITTPKMTANSINGDRIIANTLNASKIVAFSITGDKIAGNTISGDKIVANSITGDKIAANAIDGKTIQGVTITGATLQTAASGGRVVMYDDPANDGLIELYNHNGVLNGTLLGSGGGIVIDGGGTGSSMTIGGDAVDFYASKIRCHGELHGYDVYIDYVPTTSNSPAPNVWVGSAGRLYQTPGSAARFKTDIRPLSDYLDADTVVSFEPKAWRYIPGKGPTDCDTFGFVADDAAERGPLDNFVVYDDDGQISDFNYPRFSAAQQLVLREHHARVDELEAENAALRNRLDAMEQRLAALEAAHIETGA